MPNILEKEVCRQFLNNDVIPRWLVKRNCVNLHTFSWRFGELAISTDGPRCLGRFSLLLACPGHSRMPANCQKE